MVKWICIFILCGSFSWASDHGAKAETHEAAAEGEHHADEAEAGVEKEVITEIAEDIKIPLKMWEALEEKTGKKEEKKEEGKEEPKATEANELYVFSEIKVKLVQKNEDIVRKGTLQIELPRGGGALDLSTYLTGKQGSFFVKFDFPEFEDASFKKVLFISNARKRKIDDHVFGGGCREFFDITDRFFKENKKEGLKVNTTRNRHVSVLGGTFIFVAKKNKQNYLTQVTFKDKTNQNLFCQEK